MRYHLRYENSQLVPFLIKLPNHDQGWHQVELGYMPRSFDAAPNGEIVQFRMVGLMGIKKEEIPNGDQSRSPTVYLFALKEDKLLQ